MISTKKCDAYRSLFQDISINLTLALTFFTLGGIKLIESDGILAVFVAGTFFSATSTEEERRGEERVVEGADRFYDSYICACWPGLTMAGVGKTRVRRFNAGFINIRSCT